MLLCPKCLMSIQESNPLCNYHQIASDGWCKTNIIMCNMLHRGIEPKRLFKIEREMKFY